MTRGRDHPGERPGAEVIIGERPGVEVARGEACCVERDAGPVDIDAVGPLRVGAPAAVTDGLEWTCAEAWAAGFARVSSWGIRSARMPVKIIPLPGRLRGSSCSRPVGLIARRRRAEDPFRQPGVALMVPSWTGTGPDGAPSHGLPPGRVGAPMTL
jgi:hypothetical protein